MTARRMVRAGLTTIVLVATSAIAAPAHAALPTHVGAHNLSFETPLSAADDWTASITYDDGNCTGGYPGDYPSGCTDPATRPLCPTSGPDVRRGVCIVGTDVFSYQESGDYPGVSHTETVTPLDGSSMLRLGGPYTGSLQRQQRDRYVVQQKFTVQPGQTALDVNTNIYTWDYSGFDLLKVTVRAQTESGTVVYEKTRGSFASGVSLKRTGWLRNHIDLSGFEGQDVVLTVDSGGTLDDLYGFWTYVDTGFVPQPPVSPPTVGVPAQTPGADGQPVVVTTQESPDGQTFYTVPVSTVGQFPGGPGAPCMPITFSVPINPGAGTTSNVRIRLFASSFSHYAFGDQQQVLEDPDANGVWTFPAGTSLCADSGPLQVEYTVTEGGTATNYTVPIGGLTLVDPAGTIHDANLYADAIAHSATVGDALFYASIGGANVRLQRKVGGSFVNVLSGDPGISPNVNPQITPTTGPARGRFSWDVSAGDYRVVVNAVGYAQQISRVVTVPPPVLDLHVGMTPDCAADTFPHYDPFPSGGITAAALAGEEAPACVRPPCPEGQTGTYPDCTTPAGPTPGAGGSPPASTAVAPVTSTGGGGTPSTLRLLLSRVAATLRVDARGRLRTRCVVQGVAPFCRLTLTFVAKSSGRSRREKIVTTVRGVAAGSTPVLLRLNARQRGMLRRAGSKGLKGKLRIDVLDASRRTVAGGTKAVVIKPAKASS